MLNYARLKERQLHLLALLRFLLYPNVFAPAAEVHTKAEAESAVRTQLRDILELICPDISPEDTANTLLARLPGGLRGRPRRHLPGGGHAGLSRL